MCEKTLLSASKLVTGIVYATEMRQQPSIYRQTINDGEPGRPAPGPD